MLQDKGMAATQRRTSWGVVGPNQGSGLCPNQVVTGAGLPSLSQGTEALFQSGSLADDMVRTESDQGFVC